MNKSQRYQITILSPLHIGSGRKLMRGFDFEYDDRNRQTSVFDLDEICELLSDNRQAIDELSNLTGGRDSSILNLVRKYHLESRLQKSRRYSLQSFSRELLEYIRDGFGNPLIPGSSIKGSIRSAFAYHLFNGLDDGTKRYLLEGVRRERRDKFAASKIEERLFGKDPMFDLFKAMTITDAACAPADLNLGNTKVLSLSQYGGWHWKKGYKENDMEIPVEFLRPDTRCETTVRFDDFFISDPNAREVLQFDRKLYPDFSTLNRTINQLSRNLMNSEMKFIEANDPRDELRMITDFYARLERQIPDDSQGCVLRLGWGSGWTTMTGNLLEEHQDYLENFRAQFRMGRRGMPQFPKSRKIFMQGNRPETVMGWIKMEMLG